MSFEITADRKRPALLSQLIGQEFVISTLSCALQQRRVAHAYLFSGPRGVGKTSAARILARSVNCQQGVSPYPCGTCSSCIDIGAGRSLDVLEIDGASHTGVEDVRLIRDEVLFAPSGSAYKVYIIDEVHMLSQNAFNALLKTIEEPPSYVIFILVTTEKQKVLATVRSRCQQFYFQLIPQDDIYKTLETVSREESIEAEEEALTWMARESTGSLRDAYMLYDQVVSFSEGKISMEKIQQQMGLVGLDRMNQLCLLLAEEKNEEALTHAQEILQKGVSVHQFCRDLADYFWGVLLLKHGLKKAQILPFTKVRIPQKILDRYTIGQLEQGLEMILKTYETTRYSLNPRIDLLLLLSRLLTIGNWLSPRELVNRLGSLEAHLLSPTTQEDPTSPAESPPPPQEKPSLPSLLTDLETAKKRIIHTLKNSHKKDIIGGILESADWKSGPDENLVLQLSSRYSLATVKSYLSLIKEVIGKLYSEVPPITPLLQEPSPPTDSHSLSEKSALISDVFQGDIVGEPE